ncbi:hypothetical protein Godav_000483 [Gossypium davidsonii]|uniref:Uncharacterized protein n=1 Tax=Gossypium davidsonii TaxID=34287 RepID=A0A7J8SZR4_GOSDV|nr:hypothetical protein [Gossypium davidsonii]
MMYNLRILINFVAMDSTLLSFWGPMHGACFKPIGEGGLYFIQVFHVLDLKRTFPEGLGCSITYSSVG